MIYVVTSRPYCNLSPLSKWQCDYPASAHIRERVWWNVVVCRYLQKSVSNNKKPFQQHGGILCSITPINFELLFYDMLQFAAVMTEAILVFSPYSSIIHSSTRSTKLTVHWILMTIGLTSSICGLATIWYNKELNGKPHADSWHGLLGYITIGYTTVQSIAGICTKYWQFFSSFRRADLKLYHATSGVLLFILANCSLMLGMNTNWFTSKVTGSSWYACMACPALLTTIILNQITNSYIKK